MELSHTCNTSSKAAQETAKPTPPPPFIQLWRMSVDADEKFARRNVEPMQRMTEEVTNKLAELNKKKAMMDEEMQRKRDENLSLQESDAFWLLRHKSNMFYRELKDATEYNLQQAKAKEQQKKEEQLREQEVAFRSMTEHMATMRSCETDKYKRSVALRQNATDKQAESLDKLNKKKEQIMEEEDRQREMLGKAIRSEAIFQAQQQAQELNHQLTCLTEFRKEQTKEKEQREKEKLKEKEMAHQPMAQQMYDNWEKEEKRWRDRTANARSKTEEAKAKMEKEIAQKALREQEEEARKEALCNQRELSYNQRLREDVARTKAIQRSIAAHREAVRKEKDERQKAEKAEVWFL